MKETKKIKELGTLAECAIDLYWETKDTFYSEIYNKALVLKDAAILEANPGIRKWEILVEKYNDLMEYEQVVDRRVVYAESRDEVQEMAQAIIAGVKEDTTTRVSELEMLK